jgi:hypothetical protein
MEMRGGGKHRKPVESGVRIHIQAMRMPDSEAGSESLGADPETSDADLRAQWRRESGLDPSASTDEQPEGEPAGIGERTGAVLGRAWERAGGPEAGRKRAAEADAKDAEDETGSESERDRKQHLRRLNRGS